MKHLILFFTLLPILCFANGKFESDLSSSITLPENFLLQKNLAFEYNNINRYQKGLYFSESEKNNKKTSNDFPWKQTGIYGLEFLGAGVGSVASSFYAGVSIATSGDVEEGLIVYCIGNVFISSTCCWGTGKLLKQDGTWWKTVIGAGLGSLIGSIFAVRSLEKGGQDGYWTIMMYSIPAFGAVVGFNIKE